MKKIVLFTVLCVGGINGMELEQPSRWNYLPVEIRNQIVEYDGYFRFLPNDIKVNIISLLGTSTSNNLNDVIKDLKLKSLINKQWYATVNDQKAFTALVHVLADKFNTATFDIAQKFNTDASQKYLTLGTAIANAIRKKDIAQVAELIDQGADVNFMENPHRYQFGVKYRGNTLLLTAVMYQNSVDMVKLLLDAGANPNLGAHVFEAYFNIYKKPQHPKVPFADEIPKIRMLLDEARKKITK